MVDDEARLCLRPDRLAPGNKVTLLRDGAEAYPRMLEAIARARRTVLLEMYTFAEDSAGRRFAEALAARAHEGLDVRLLYDGLGSRESPREFFGRLRAQGVRVLEFHPIHRFLFGLRHRRRNHRKLLAIDGKVAFVGGLNISREYASPAEGGLGWRDTQVEIKGPAAAELAGMFAELWRQERRRDPPPEIEPLPPRERGLPLLVLSSHRFRRRWEIGRHFLHALRHARERIWIANPYFLPSARFRRALRAAARRGVDVRVLVPANNDVAPAGYASQALYARYLKRRIRIFEWPGRMMHAKTAVVDGVWSTVGSYNLDHLSLFHNYEVSAIVLGSEFGRRMEAMFEEDVAKCRELNLREWKRRGWARKLLEEVFYLFRTFF